MKSSSGISEAERKGLEDVFLSISKSNRVIVRESLNKFFSTTKNYTISFKNNFVNNKTFNKLPKYRKAK